MPQPVSSQDYRRALAQFASGVTVVTTCVEDTIHGMTASAFTSVSLDPPLILVCVKRRAAMHGLLERSGAFVANILGAEQEGLAAWFANHERPYGPAQFADVPWRPAEATGCPVLSGALAHLDCRVRDTHEAGDHSIFVGEVVATAVAVDERGPLLYFRSGYRRLGR